MKDVPGDLKGLSCGWCKSPRIRRRLDHYAYEYATMLQVVIFVTFACAWMGIKLVDAIVELLSK